MFDGHAETSTFDYWNPLISGTLIWVSDIAIG